MKLTMKLFVCFVFSVIFGVATTQAQMRCDECDPYNSSCELECWWCNGMDHQDGSCRPEDVAYSTCGDYMGACLPYGCTPAWRTTSRVNVGTYGTTTYGWSCTWGSGCAPTFGCNHHRVDRVTETDINQCNISPSYRSRQFCDDWVDASKPHKSWPPPDCCDPFICMPYPDPRCFYDDTFTCNDWHSCW